MGQALNKVENRKSQRPNNLLFYIIGYQAAHLPLDTDSDSTRINTSH